jgi:cation transport ATPase
MATKRKRRKPRGSRPAATAPARPLPSRYERSRQKDEAARRALKPLARGERPTAVTVGAIVAALIALANLVAAVLGWDGGTDADAGQALAGSLLVTAVVCIVAVGMWRAKYWAVLGMQTLLAITLVICSLALVTATSIVAALILVVMLAAAGTLFWFLVKAMARIQMPERPGASRR